MFIGLRSYLCPASVATIFWCAAYIKNHIPIKHHDLILIKLFKILIRIVATLIFIIGTHFSIILLACVHDFLDILLRIKYGKQYGGTLPGGDHAFIVSKAIVNGLFMHEYKHENTPSELYDFYLKLYTRIVSTHPKLSCIRQKFLDYSFYLKTTVDIKAGIKYIDNYETEEEFQLRLEEIFPSPLPMDNAMLWDVHIGKTPIHWNCNSSGPKRIPVVLRFQHCVGDGISIFALITTNFMKDGVESLRKRCDNYRALLRKPSQTTRSSKTNQARQMLSSVLDYMKRELLFNLDMNPESTHLLRSGEKLSGRKYICWATEKAGENYVDKIKRIKNRFVDVGFMDVVNAAMSASLLEHYEKYNQVPPIHILVANTFFLKSTEFNKIVHFNKDNTPITDLTSKTTMGMIKLPLQNTLIKERLIQASVEMNRLKRAYDFGIILYLDDILVRLVPERMFRFIMSHVHLSLLMTNVPGINASTTKNDYKISDVMCWADNFLEIGISTTVFTFENSLRLGMYADVTAIPKRSDAQAIIENVFKYIDVLDKVTECQ